MSRVDIPRASSRSTSLSRDVGCRALGVSAWFSPRTMAEALRASNALSPRLTSRIARISAEVSTSLTTYPRGTGPHGAQHEVLVQERREHEDPELGMRRGEVGAEVEALGVGRRGELEVQQDDLGAAPGDDRLGLRRRRRLRDDDPSGEAGVPQRGAAAVDASAGKVPGVSERSPGVEGSADAADDVTPLAHDSREVAL